MFGLEAKKTDENGPQLYIWDYFREEDTLHKRNCEFNWHRTVLLKERTYGVFNQHKSNKSEMESLSVSQKSFSGCTSWSLIQQAPCSTPLIHHSTSLLILTECGLSQGGQEVRDEVPLWPGDCLRVLSCMLGELRRLNTTRFFRLGMMMIIYVLFHISISVSVCLLTDNLKLLDLPTDYQQRMLLTVL